MYDNHMPQHPAFPMRSHPDCSDAMDPVSPCKSDWNGKERERGGDDRLKKMYKIGMQAMSSLYINAKIKNTKEMKDSGAQNIRAAIRTSPSATLPTTTTARGSRVEWNVVCRKRGMYLTSKL